MSDSMPTKAEDAENPYSLEGLISILDEDELREVDLPDSPSDILKGALDEYGFSAKKHGRSERSLNL